MDTSRNITVVNLELYAIYLLLVIKLAYLMGFLLGSASVKVLYVHQKGKVGLSQCIIVHVVIIVQVVIWIIKEFIQGTLYLFLAERSGHP